MEPLDPAGSLEPSDPALAEFGAFDDDGGSSIRSSSGRPSKTSYRGAQGPCKQCLKECHFMAANNNLCLDCNSIRMACFRDSQKSEEGKKAWDRGLKDPVEMRKVLNKYTKCQKTRAKGAKRYLPFDWVEYTREFFAVKRAIRGGEMQYCGRTKYIELMRTERDMDHRKAVAQWELHSADPDAFGIESDNKYGSIRLLTECSDFVRGEEEKGEKHAVASGSKRKKNVTDDEHKEMLGAVGSGFESSRSAFIAEFTGKNFKDDDKGLTRTKGAPRVTMSLLFAMGPKQSEAERDRERYRSQLGV